MLYDYKNEFKARNVYCVCPLGTLYQGEDYHIYLKDSEDIHQIRFMDRFLDLDEYSVLDVCWDERYIVLCMLQYRELKYLIIDSIEQTLRVRLEEWIRDPKFTAGMNLPSSGMLGIYDGQLYLYFTDVKVSSKETSQSASDENKIRYDNMTIIRACNLEDLAQSEFDYRAKTHNLSAIYKIMSGLEYNSDLTGIRPNDENIYITGYDDILLDIKIYDGILYILVMHRLFEQRKIEKYIYTWDFGDIMEQIPIDSEYRSLLTVYSQKYLALTSEYEDNEPIFLLDLSNYQTSTLEYNTNEETTIVTPKEADLGIFVSDDILAIRSIYRPPLPKRLRRYARADRVMVKYYSRNYTRDKNFKSARNS